MGANFPFILPSVGIGTLKSMPNIEYPKLISCCCLHGIMVGELAQDISEMSDDYSPFYYLKQRLHFAIVLARGLRVCYAEPTINTVSTLNN